MDFRHEWKHEINLSDMIALRQRLRAIARPDPHAVDGKYEVRSLYFDNLADKALREKLDGVNIREKFRIRYYNSDVSCIHLEKKYKRGSLGNKMNTPLTEEETSEIVNGRFDWMRERREPLIQELYTKITAQGLRPKTIVDYTREPYLYPPGNVRITIDYHIRTGLFQTDFLNPGCPTVPIKDDPVILEVKWDAWLPDIIRSAVQLENRRCTAFSKYAACRMYD
ncbi:MAG: polyphosphate polymerase domain-containing protein [Blautia sp.]|nr:polyphosphate polymerase domain-containing protein [Blautia sp.]MCM1199807.1 polyphosphate polymerase domain-containing protein [Bacteroides fragilis]